MIRRFFVWLHRWFGLAMALFLVIEGLTGSMLAFNAQLTKLFNPRLFVVSPKPGAAPLDPATLAARVSQLVPQARMAYFARVRDDQVVLRCSSVADPVTGKPYDIGFGYLVLDPYTGEELGRLKEGGYSEGFLPNVMPFIYSLHTSLALGATGGWILFVVAVVWSVDCFVGFYLTLPTSLRRFWPRFGRAWQVKWGGGAFRLNFDLHRAGGLWLWPLLLVFAWSSVNLVDHLGVYEWVMGRLFDYEGTSTWITKFYPHHPIGEPKLNWQAAQTAGDKLIREQAASEGFKVVKPVSLNFFGYSGRYNYSVQTNRLFPRDRLATVFFDANSGVFASTLETRTERLGNTVSNWLRALHMITDPVDYLAYRVVVFIVGLGIAMLSVTGIYIWWRKRRARSFSASKRGSSRTPSSPNDTATSQSSTAQLAKVK